MAFPSDLVRQGMDYCRGVQGEGTVGRPDMAREREGSPCGLTDVETMSHDYSHAAAFMKFL